MCWLGYPLLHTGQSKKNRLLTYMSIRDHIKDCVDNGTLFYLPPWTASKTCDRFMFVSPEVRDMVEPTNREARWEMRGSRLRADLDLFSEGGYITASMTPYQARSAYMGLLHPGSSGWWDIRSRDPNPGLRVLGGFAEKDVFIALTWEERAPLGDGRSRQWNQAIVRCQCEWRNRFYAYEPVRGEAINEFITKNAVLA